VAFAAHDAGDVGIAQFVFLRRAATGLNLVRFQSSPAREDASTRFPQNDKGRCAEEVQTALRSGSTPNLLTRDGSRPNRIETPLWDFTMRRRKIS
jgi:hypothetical protein